jgi:enoyl-CoA hydratase/carnithine racemase
MIEQLKSYLQVTAEDLKRPVILKQKNDVFYLLLNTKANAYTKEFVRAIQAEIDKVEANDGPTAMVTVSLSKLFSGGLDLKYTSNLELEDARYFII